MSFPQSGRNHLLPEHPQRIEADFGKGETAKLRLFRSHRDSRKALSGRAVCYRFRTLTPCPTELHAGWRPRTADGAKREARG